MRVSLQYGAVHESPGVTFIGIADDIFGVSGGTTAELPLAPGGETGTATTTQPGCCYLGDNLFRARIENVSDGMTLMVPGGGSVAVPLAPGVFVVHTDDDPLFMAGMPDQGAGLEGLAEDGDIASFEAALALGTRLATPLAPGPRKDGQWVPTWATADPVINRTAMTIFM